MWCDKVLVFLLICLFPVKSARILVVFPIPAQSHVTQGFILAKNLALRGHNVTFLTGILNKPVANVTQIKIASERAQFEDFKEGFFGFAPKTLLGQLMAAQEEGLKFSEDILRNPHFLQLIQSNIKFDLVLLEPFLVESLMVLGQIFGCPIVLLVAGPTNILSDYMVGNPLNSALVPNFLSDLPSEMTFSQRIFNVFYDLTQILYRELFVIPKSQKLLEETLNSSLNLRTSLYKASLILQTSHIGLYHPVAKPPTIIDIGGYHIEDPKPLPQDLQEFLDNAPKSGVILFSMGNNLKNSDFKKEKLQAILSCFKKLNLKILWKLEEDLQGLPDNVKTVKWLPQNDVLSHEKIKLFISHGGLLSTFEALHHGVPVLGVPVFWDQRINIKALVQKG